MGATPQEEIQRQHQEAQNLVKEIAVADRMDRGEISLAFKTRPVSEEIKNRSHKTMSIPPCWTSRGQVDITQLQNLVKEGYNNTKRKALDTHKQKYTEKDIASKTDLWDPIHASLFNVNIHRPSHDAWGINKIVLVFSDDFLQDIYELPWWHDRPDLRAAIQPILDTLGIQETQIARLLLASLPPGVTIPVHFDTGEWVKVTHRVHVPVLVQKPNQILFRCGPAKDQMERIDCSPGHVFEINNQAYHAVSNCDSDHRVHLILDYLDAEATPRRRHTLEAGEILLQTRRSIDRLQDRGTRNTPSFLILGAQKAGTTSLYEYTTQHPLVVPARRRETHCLDWRWNDKAKNTEERREWCHKFFFEKELQLHPSCLTGDSTPSYLLDSKRVIPRIQEVFNWPMKFMVILRDPLRRAESHYAMVTSTEGTQAQLQTRGFEWRDKSFRQVVEEELHRMKDIGLIPYWDMERGTVDPEVFDAFVDSPLEDAAWDRYLSDIPMNTGSHCLLGRSLYALNLRPWFRAFRRDQFLVLGLEEYTADGVLAVMERVWRHLELPPCDLTDDDAKNTRDYESPMDAELRAYLQRFLAPHNARLAVLLGSDSKVVSLWQQ